MDRITELNLDRLAGSINQTLGTPEQPYTKIEGGGYRPNEGCYHIEIQSGFFNLVRMSNESGGTNLELSGTTKRDLYDQMQAYLKGIRTWHK